MPCRSDDDDYRPHSREDRKMVDELTALLCSACRAAVKGGFIDKLPIDVRGWWVNHREKDKVRIEKEIKQSEQILKNFNAQLNSLTAKAEVERKKFEALLEEKKRASEKGIDDVS